MTSRHLPYPINTCWDKPATKHTLSSPWLARSPWLSSRPSWYWFPSCHAMWFAAAARIKVPINIAIAQGIALGCAMRPATRPGNANPSQMEATATASAWSAQMTDRLLLSPENPPSRSRYQRSRILGPTLDVAKTDSTIEITHAFSIFFNGWTGCDEWNQ